MKLDVKYTNGVEEITFRDEEIRQTKKGGLSGTLSVQGVTKERI